MSDFQKFMHAQAEKDAAYQQYNYSGQLLENKTIMCRFAEIQSQHQPLATIIGESMATREQLIAACHFVITGRLPEKYKIAPQKSAEAVVYIIKKGFYI